MADPHEREQPTNGSADHERWPTSIRAARMCGVTKQTIGEWVKSGELHPVLDARGVRRFDPAELEDLTEDTEQQQPRELGLLRESIESMRLLLETGWRQQLEAHKEQARQIEALLKLVPDHTQKVMQTQDGMIGRLYTRVEQLEQERTEMFDVMQGFIKSREELELRKVEAQQRGKLYDKCADALVENAPKLVQDILLSAELRKMIAHGDPDMLTAMLDAGGDQLNEDVRRAVTRIRDMMLEHRESLKRKADAANAKMAEDQKTKTEPGPNEPGKTRTVETEGKTVG